MVTLAKLKAYLRIDIDAEDALLTGFLTTAENYLKGAISNYTENYSASAEFADKADFLQTVLAAEFWQNRESTEHNLSYTVRTLITQLQLFAGGDNDG